MNTGIIFHKKFLEHNLGQGHPERPERLKNTMELIKGILKDTNISVLRPEAATEKDLLRVHTERYVDEIKALSERGGILTLDTPLPMGTYDAAVFSAGGAILAGEAVFRGSLNNSFALTRPPGHHAGKGYGGGFCFFNNIAVMVEYLRKRYNLKRFAVLDWDVHHGNGTQDIFYKDPTVLYFSTHQSPLYPGTGRLHEIGSDEGRGYNVNMPLSPGTSGVSFIYVLERLFIPLVKEFEPEIICISAGYDAYFKDPLASLRFTIETYQQAADLVLKAAEEVCGGRVVAVLEGGYHLEAVALGIYSTITTFAGLNGMKESGRLPPQMLNEEVRIRVSDLKNLLSDYWKIL